VEQLASQVIAALSSVPPVLIYLIAAIWVGIESDGIGVPVEPVMLFVGSLASRQVVSLPLSIVTSAVGCLTFGTLMYVVGRRYGQAVITRIGRFVGLTPARAEHLELWLRHRGLLGVTVLRMTPLVRSFSCLICGTADIAPAKFAVGTFVGSAIYCGVWITVGNILGKDYVAPLHFLDQLGFRGILIAVGIVVVLFVGHRLLGSLVMRRMARHFHLHHHKEHAAGPLPAGTLDA
jgi:membrane protein DedA with SNARE-associated domain